MAKRIKAVPALVVLAVIIVLAGGFMMLIRNKPIQGNNKVQTGAVSTLATSGSSAEQSANDRQAELDRLYQQGYEYYRQRQYQDAVATLDLVIADGPGYYQAYTIKGIALCFDGHFDEGMKSIDQALKLKPDYGSARFNKALAYELYAHYDTAIYWYDQTIAVEPDSVWSYYGKASIYGRRGDIANTVKNLKQAIALNPEAKKDARTEPDFNNVRNSPEFQSLVKD
ncbi:MAG: tetratricopeptide repeat protein [Thermacetogeniaceae bacterium]